MRKLASLGIILLSIGWGIGCTTVEPGHVGIKMNMYGSDKGVQNVPLVTGVQFYNPMGTRIYEYPTFVQSAVWTKSPHEGGPANEEITFTTADQMPVSADISLAYHLIGEKVPSFYVKFRSDDLNQFTHGFLRNLAREKFDNTAGRYKIEAIMGDNAAFLGDVRKALQDDLDPIGVAIDQFGFIGAPRPPQGVIDAINAKVKATQDAIKVENEVRSARAEAEKVVATAEGEARARVTEAEGRAKANKILQQSISKELLEWRALDIQAANAQKWDGKLPSTILGTQGVPLINVERK